MDNRRFAWIAGGGCLLLTLLVVGVVALLVISPLAIFSSAVTTNQPAEEVVVEEEGGVEQVRQVPTLTLAPQAENGVSAGAIGLEGVSLEELYEELNAGVVSIQVLVEQQGVTGGGEGSGFFINDEGFIVTNNHVVTDAQSVVAITFDGTQLPAEVIGTDPDSDLAVIQVAQMPENTHPLPLADSSAVNPGQWVVAIGNPFGLSSSMSVGIVSATGRAIPSGATPYQIPQAIQTDAAINPGNSGGPLLNLNGEVIGVNAQIRTAGVAANSGVGFAIPSNVVRRVVPALIEEGTFQWPYLGVSGTNLNLFLAEANNLDTQQGAYIASVQAGGPAAEAGLQGSTGSTSVDGIEMPTGGDVVVAADGMRVSTFDQLVELVALHDPGDTMDLTVLRNGEEQEFTVTLQPRPANAGDTTTIP